MTSAGEVRHLERSRPSAVWRQIQPTGLFAKYALILVCLVVFVLAVTGAVETWIIYRETTAALGRAQKEAGETVARRTESFLSDLQRQISWATRASATTVEQRRADYELLLQQVPAISQLEYVDGNAHEQLRVTRDEAIVGSEMDLSHDPNVTEALNRPVWSGSTYFQANDPYMSVAMAHSGYRAGATVAHIDLHVLSKFLNAVPLSGSNYSYILDAAGRVVAASKGSPVEIGSDLGALFSIKPLIKSKSEIEAIGKSIDGRSVMRTGVRIEDTQWAVVVEEATREALAPITEFLFRLIGIMALGLVLAIFAGLFLARRMIVPIQAIQEGAASFALNRFDHRISVKTGDELEELADRFNHMAEELAGSYARLEQKVEERTRDLARSVRELKALEEIGRALSSSLDLNAVLSAVVSRAVELTQADAGAIYSYDGASRGIRLEHAQGFPSGWASDASAARPQSDGALTLAMSKASPVVIPSLEREAGFPLRDSTLRAGFKSAFVIGLNGTGETQGALIMYRKRAGDFGAGTSGVMQTFAHQSVLAMHNARLFRELIDKSRQLEIAGAHRTQFFANMNHELRTPLNAVLGYSELLADGLYGTMPERAVGVLERIQSNGKHLLGLINDVLDLTKLEAGGLTLSLADYSMKGLVEGVVATTESLARTKGLQLEAEVANDLSVAFGDERRLTQVLLNLVGNAIKFTDEGSVRVEVAMESAAFRVAVIDTGPGIAPEEQARIFNEFQQVDNANTRKKGGTGLGLAISRRLVEMHGGRIEVVSDLGRGATFAFVVPVRVAEQIER